MSESVFVACDSAISPGIVDTCGHLVDTLPLSRGAVVAILRRCLSESEGFVLTLVNGAQLW